MTAPVKAARPLSIDLTSGFCRMGNHGHCPGSGDNGRVDEKVALWFCDCECHDAHPVCRDCRSVDVELTLQGTCVDVADCQDAIVRRRAANPVAQLLHSLTQDQQERATRAAEARRAVRVATGQPVRVRREPPQPQRCHCGCGGMTKGGRFIAGHDAKLKGMLVKAARQTSEGTSQTAAIRAMAELVARDWPRKHVDSAVTEKAEALFDEYGPDRVIDTAVAARYGE